MEINVLRRLLQVLLSAALLGAALFGAARHASAASIIYVKYNAGGTNDGTSWANAYKSLQVALSHAVGGDQIWVAKGTYKPGNSRSATFTMRPDVAIYGGFAGGETLLSQRKWKTNVTILSGEIGTTSAADNVYHVVTCGGVVSTGILDGFTIQAGHASGASPDDSGAGVYCLTSSATLKNLVVKNNLAIVGGGGIYNYNGNPNLVNVTLSGNQAGDKGGGLHTDSGSPVLRNVTFSGNHASYGGGLYSTVGAPDIRKVKFMSNTGLNGGAMYADAGSNPVVVNTTFSGNSSVNGGAVYAALSSTASFTRVKFINNSSVSSGASAQALPTQCGGAIWSEAMLSFTDVTFSGNKAGNYGGALYNFGQATLNGATFLGNTAANGGAIAAVGPSTGLTNVTFTGNTALANGAVLFANSPSITFTNATLKGNSTPGHGGAIYNASSTITIYDSIFWSNGPSQVYTYSGSGPTVADSIIGGGCPAGGTCSHVLTQDPKLGPLQNNGGFTQTMAPGVRSPAIDHGNAGTCASTDQRGIARPQGLGCDLGAYEIKAMAFVSQAVYDGQVIESGAGTNVGGIANSTYSTLFVGDYSTGERLRGFLSFNTAPLADGSAIVAAKLHAEQLSDPTGTPFATLGKLVADQARPYFGAGPGLVASDWQASATVSPAGAFGSVPSGGWYTAPLTSSGLTNLNKTGLTQFRLRFTLTDSNAQADYIIFKSGDDSTPADRPVLYVYYNP